VFGKKLEAVLDKGEKVCVAIVQSNLTELEANDMENQLITADKSGKFVWLLKILPLLLDPENDVCCNKQSGR
jgi:hypothetical protein